MQWFAFFVAYVLLVEEKLEKKDQQKAKKYAKMEWKKLKELKTVQLWMVYFGLPVDDKLRSLDVSHFLSIFSSKANRRASIKSAFCVLVVAFVRFNEPLAIFMRSLMPRSLLSWVRGTSMLNENWGPRSVGRFFLGTDGLFPSAITNKFPNKYIFRAATAKTILQTELELWNSVSKSHLLVKSSLL